MAVPTKCTALIIGEGHAWNFIRSESDDLLFKHAAISGARIFEETKVEAIEFKSSDEDETKKNKSLLGRPTSATWRQKDGSTGSIAFDYLIDASGRQGILTTKYLKSRTVNQNFKNAANWAYWRTDKLYGVGTHMEGSPYFEALQVIQGSVDTDTSGDLSRQDISHVLDFCYKAFVYVPPERKEALFSKLEALNIRPILDGVLSNEGLDHVKAQLSDEEWQTVEILRSRRMIREDPFDIDSFTLDAIDGLAPKLQRGRLGLVAASRAKLDNRHFYSPAFLDESSFPYPPFQLASP
ncbi:hypothetical protein BD289DRAFT_455411 [Coniella lustricola]|uniref:Uncharacterized protein n=1 Tax=Coniella lustricola TaxID=2025994 RepID=A0A2T2ZZW1_9PEZI|nr:hypothetical protein BD289DRAFT_455411 [Coniella lustricola]